MYALTKSPEKREEKFRLSLFNVLELKELNIDSLECFSFFFNGICLQFTYVQDKISNYTDR